MTSPSAEGGQNNWAAVIAASMAVVVVTIDLFGLNVALADIGRDLGGSTTQLQWVINGYSLALTAFLIPMGRTADMQGRRRVMLAGLLAFGVLSGAAAAAPTMEWLIAFRVLTGVAAAAIAATSLSIVSDAVTDAKRAVAVSTWTAVTAVGSAIGPVVGGFIVELLSWRWFFAVNVGAVVAITLLILVAVPGDGPVTGERPQDLFGATAFIVGLGGVVVAIMQGPQVGWLEPVTIISGVAGVVFLVLFVRTETRVEHPMVDLTLFRGRTYAGVSTVAFTANWAYGVMLFYLPLYMQEVLDLSPAQAGSVFLAFTVPYVGLSLLAGRAQRHLRARTLMASGMIVLVVASLLLVGVGRSDAIWIILAALVIAALGQALAFNVSGTEALAAVDRDDAGLASGVLSTVRQGGSLMGLAVTGAVFTSVETAIVQRRLADLGLEESDAGPILDSITGSSSANDALAELAPDLAARADTLLNDVFSQSLGWAMALVAVVCLVGVIGALLSSPHVSSRSEG
jgi:EmrB/QacA subfamily drug resistance transporter